MNPLEHLTDLLYAHDGDDRCGCLRDIVRDLACGGNSEDQVRDAVQHLSNCLAEHPAGLSIRSRIPDTPADLDAP
jgi:hypothetical protein